LLVEFFLEDYNDQVCMNTLKQKHNAHFLCNRQQSCI